MENLTPMTGIGASHLPELWDYVTESLDHEEVFHYLGFEKLHRINIVSLQNQLIAHRESMTANTGAGETQMTNMRRLLADYTTAIHNYNYIRSGKRLPPHETDERKQRLKHFFPSMVLGQEHTRPFESHYYYLHDGTNHPQPDYFRNALRKHLPCALTYSSHERRHRALEFEQGKPPLEISSTVDNLVRLSIALLAVLALVAPMCIMSVKPSLIKNLVTASIFMVVFACTVSFIVKTSNIETLVATATYSAVLVVFVGTNS